MDNRTDYNRTDFRADSYRTEFRTDYNRTDIRAAYNRADYIEQLFEIIIEQVFEQIMIEQLFETISFFRSLTTAVPRVQGRADAPQTVGTAEWWGDFPLLLLHVYRGPHPRVQRWATGPSLRVNFSHPRNQP